MHWKQFQRTNKTGQCFMGRWGSTWHHRSFWYEHSNKLPRLWACSQYLCRATLFVCTISDSAVKTPPFRKLALWRNRAWKLHQLVRVLSSACPYITVYLLYTFRYPYRAHVIVAGRKNKKRLAWEMWKGERNARTNVWKLKMSTKMQSHARTEQETAEWLVNNIPEWRRDRKTDKEQRTNMFNGIYVHRKTGTKSHRQPNNENQYDEKTVVNPLVSSSPVHADKSVISAL